MGSGITVWFQHTPNGNCHQPGFSEKGGWPTHLTFLPNEFFLSLTPAIQPVWVRGLVEQWF
jgi:hypothetical protein